LNKPWNFPESANKGAVTLDGNEQPFAMTFIQVGGHEDAFTPVGDDKLKKKVKEREKKFYESLLGENAYIRDYVPHFYGTESDGDDHYVIMENILAGFTKPCVVDIKIGTSSIPEDASPTKKAIMGHNDRTSTSATLGVRVIGMHYYDQSDDTKVIKRDKPWGKALKDGQVLGALMDFFGPEETRLRVLPAILHNLCQIRSVIESQHRVRLYSSSILIAYDAEMGGMAQSPRVRMIDFSHVFPIEEEGGVDKGYLTGIRNLIRILQNELPTEDSRDDN